MQTSLLILCTCTKTVPHIFSWCGILDCPVPFFNHRNLCPRDHLLRMVMEPEYYAEKVIGHPNHPLTRWLHPHHLNMTWNITRILGVSRSAKADDIKRAYRKRSLRFHPVAWMEIYVPMDVSNGNLKMKMMICKRHIMFFKGWCSASPS